MGLDSEKEKSGREQTMTERTYRRAHLVRTYLFSLRAGSAQYQDYAVLNKSTGHVTVSHTWFRSAGHLIQRAKNTVILLRA